MAIVFAYGFDQGLINPALAGPGGPGWINFASGTAFSFQSAIKRSGALALRCNPVAGATGALGWGTIDAATGQFSGLNLSEGYVRFYFQYTTKPAANEEEIFSLRTAGNARVLQVFINSAGKLHVQANPGGSQGTSTATLVASTWYRVEVYFKIGVTGLVELRVDGTTEVSGSGVFTLVNFDNALLGKALNTNGQTVDFYYDDLMIDNATWPGPGRVVELRPNANGTYQDWLSGPAPQDYTQVNEIPVDALNATPNYIQNTGAAPNQVSTFFVDNPITAGVSGKVKAVISYVYQRENVAGSGNWRIRTRVNGVNFDAVSLDAGATMTQQGKIYLTNPNTGLNWKRADLLTIEAGPLQANALAMRCGAVGLVVAFNDEEPGDSQPLLALLGAGT